MCSSGLTHLPRSEQKPWTLRPFKSSTWRRVTINRCRSQLHRPGEYPAHAGLCHLLQDRSHSGIIKQTFASFDTYPTDGVEFRLSIHLGIRRIANETRKMQNKCLATLAPAPLQKSRNCKTNVRWSTHFGRRQRLSWMAPVDRRLKIVLWPHLTNDAGHQSGPQRPPSFPAATEAPTGHDHSL